MRILVVDDHPISRLGVSHLIARGWPESAVDEAASVDEGIRAVASTAPDAIVLGLTAPGAAGQQAVVRMLEAARGVPILVLSFTEESHAAARLLQLGVAGCLQKTRPCEEILVALGRVLSGKRYVTESIADHLVDLLGGRTTAAAPHASLSKQEHRVMVLIAEGHSPSSIAERLGISARTAGTYRARILEKTGWRSNVELAKYCVQQGLLDAD